MTKKDKKPPHRPPFAPTDEQRRQVQLMASMGMQKAAIAAVIGVCPNTLDKHLRDELETGWDKVNVLVAANVVRQATRNDFRAIPAATWWLGRRGGEAFIDRSRQELTGADGGPVEISAESPRERIARRLARLAPAKGPGEDS